MGNGKQANLIQDSLYVMLQQSNTLNTEIALKLSNNTKQN